MDYSNMKSEDMLPVVKELNILLAEYHMYYQKLRNFHWNILGKNFFDLHIKFEELYEDARVKIDDIAERILTLRYHPLSRYSEYLEVSEIKEEKSSLPDHEMVDILLQDHKLLLKRMKSVIDQSDKAGDEGTIDLIGAYIRELEKASWMLNVWTKKTDDQLKTIPLSEY